MKKFKKLASLVCVVLIAAMAISSFSLAVGIDYYNMPNEYLAELIGTSIEDVQRTKDSLGKNFNPVLEKYLSETRDLRTNSTHSTYSTNVSANDWNNFSAATNTGAIIVSKDATFSSIRHGHCALCYTNSGTTFEVIEHPGTNYKSLRQPASVSFSKAITLATFMPKNVTTQQKAQAASYARDNLQGWDYSALAARSSTKYLNCATLVWKAYDYAGVVSSYPDPDPNSTVIPRYYDNNSYTTRLYANSAYINTSW